MVGEGQCFSRHSQLTFRILDILYVLKEEIVDYLVLYLKLSCKFSFKVTKTLYRITVMTIESFGYSLVATSSTSLTPNTTTSIPKDISQIKAKVGSQENLLPF